MYCTLIGVCSPHYCEVGVSRKLEVCRLLNVPENKQPNMNKQRKKHDEQSSIEWLISADLA